jgi:hypothetical protein
VAVFGRGFDGAVDLRDDKAQALLDELKGIDGKKGQVVGGFAQSFFCGYIFWGQ